MACGSALAALSDPSDAQIIVLGMANLAVTAFSECADRALPTLGASHNEAAPRDVSVLSTHSRSSALTARPWHQQRLAASPR
jgi:hypothetical protein